MYAQTTQLQAENSNGLRLGFYCERIAQESVMPPLNYVSINIYI
jgi:hypothetical protein